MMVIGCWGYAAVTYRPEAAYGGWLWALGGSLYVGLTLSHYLLLRQQALGTEWVLAILFTTFANDTAAYAVGRIFGRHKLAPLVSPGKTWEGATAALIVATVALPVLAQPLGLPLS